MRLAIATVIALSFLLAGCGKEESAAAPPPSALTAEAMGRYCGMNVLEHPGPKGQIMLQQVLEPIWFSSARDAIAFTMLPEEPKDIAAIYVSDMSKAPNWDHPGAENWVDARKAFFVIGSSARGGMGVEEAVPFSAENDARTFAWKNGGRVVGFSDVPKEYILGAGTEPPSAGSSETSDDDGEGHHHG
ncbi:nitrous oxide reductase accessory protein NosL [Rhizobium puerariae]|uniref:Nitrous oxide reductase accessory protein NosL n=1 Tax=Rhizobium puerariae TaxID=1585791 RepID=A0ABV6AC72_9HYPH